MLNTTSVAKLSAVLVFSAMASTYASASIVANGLTGTIEYNGWDSLTASDLSSADLASGFTANEAGSGDATLTRISGGIYPASSSLYSFSSDSIMSVADTSAVSGLETVVFSILSWANPEYDDGATDIGVVSSAPVLNFNGGSQALSADLIGASYYGPFSGGGFDVESYVYTYQWDLSTAGVSSFDIEWGQRVHAGLLALQLEQSDTFTVSTQVSQVPVPAAAWLFGSALLGLAGVGRKRSK